MKSPFYSLLILLLLLFACNTDKNPHAPQSQEAPRSALMTKQNDAVVERHQLQVIQSRIEAMAPNLNPVKNRVTQAPQTIIVPDPDNGIYTIQDGVNAASPQDTVLVLAGTYTEEIFINVPNICLFAEPGVLVKGGCYFLQDNITMENFHVVVQRTGGSGIVVRDVSGSVVRKNTVEGGFFGIALNGSSFSLVEKNEVVNSEHDGLILHTAHNNTVTKNECYGHRYDGLEVGESSTANEISHNHCENNGSDGIRLHTSSTNHVLKNKCMNNGNGIGLLFSSEQNTIEKNKCNENELRGISLVENADNNLIGANNIANKNGDCGILLDVNTSGNSVFKNIFLRNEHFDILNLGTNNEFSKNKAMVVEGTD